MSGRVELDTAELDAGVRQLLGGIDDGIRPGATQTARDVARRLVPLIPVRTGRLRRSVDVSTTSNGAAVHYGTGLAYAGYIDGRTGATARALEGAPSTFHDAMRTLAAREVRQL